MTWEAYKNVDYSTITRSGVAAAAPPNTRVQLFSAPKLVQLKKQFIETTASRANFVEQFQTLAPKVFRHHQLERVQRDVHNHQIENLGYGQLLIQMDYAENIKLVVRQ